MKKIAVVGAGFSGAVIAHCLAKAGCSVTVFEGRSHIAGNCHTQRDEQTGVMVHLYGPHIFHTNDKRIWEFVAQFDEIMPFTNRVKAVSGGKVYSFPINLLTINSYFGLALNPRSARDFIDSLSEKGIVAPGNFEEQALRMVGKDLYDSFFKGYTLKQWGLSPTELPASILKRLPIRFDYNDNYYDSRYQGIPRNGYTYIVERLLRQDRIDVRLNTQFSRQMRPFYNHVFYTGTLDGWFDYSEGLLSYRTLDFEAEYHSGDYQGNAVINYCDLHVPWTRVSEHKHFSPWESHEHTIIYKEFSRPCGMTDSPYYPVRSGADKKLLQKYIELAQLEKDVTFVGRLGTYRYLDMHVSISEALQTAELYLEGLSQKKAMPAFLVSPLS